MRIALASTIAATAMLATPALAAPYSDIGDFASYSFDVDFSRVGGAGAAGAGDIFDVTVTGVNGNSTEEFEGVDGFLSALSGGFQIQLSVGNANNGQTITTDFDRAGVVDLAETNAAGAETGNFVFTISSTTGINIIGTGAQTIAAVGLLNIVASTFYDTPEEGSWSFGGSYNSSTGDGSGSITIVTPPDPEVVSEPGMLALAGAGLLGLAVVRRRVR